MFGPAGMVGRPADHLLLPLDGYEAIRLADYEGLQQEEVARRLGVSRPTVSRILDAARRTVAAALVEGRGLLIQGGPVRFVPPGGGPPWARGRGWRHRRGRGGPPHAGP